MSQNVTGSRLFRAQPTKPLDLEATDRAERKDSVHAPPCTRVNLQSPPPQDAAATGSPVAVAQSIAVAVVPNLDGLAGATSTPRLSIVSPPPEGVNPPGFIPSDRVAFLSRIRQESRLKPCSFRNVIQTGLWPVSPFVDGCVPSTTCNTHTSRHCLAAVIAELPFPST